MSEEVLAIIAGGLVTLAMTSGVIAKKAVELQERQEEVTTDVIYHYLSTRTDLNPERRGAVTKELVKRLL